MVLPTEYETASAHKGEGNKLTCAKRGEWRGRVPLSDLSILESDREIAKIKYA